MPALLPSRPAGPRAPRAYATLPAALAAAAALTGCFTSEPDPLPKPKPNVLSACVDVPAGSQAKADSLIGVANGQMAENFEYWANRTDSWWDAKRRNPQAAVDNYDAALAAAPGHCQAIFGRAIANATLLSQDTRLDDFVRKVEDASDEEASGLAKRGSFAAVMRTSPDQAAPLLVRLAADLKRVDGPSVKEAQALVETVILPKLDSTIAALEKVMDYSLFAIRYGLRGDTVEIDRGEVGPGLAGLKVAKAWLTVVAGHNIDPAPDGTWDWYRTLASMEPEDFDRLTPAQTAALDHYTGLFKTTSPFTRVKAGWADRIQAIPTLLLGAVGDAQKGLESAIEEARSGDPQIFDALRAGTGEDADIDTADLRGAIVLLERSKKYLTGEQEVEYDRGTRRIKVNLTRLFHLDGAQNLLPYFKFRPYAEWNDTISADTSWGTYAGWETQREIIARTGYDLESADRNAFDGALQVHDSLSGNFTGPRLVASRKIVYAWYDEETGMMQSKVLAQVVPVQESPCDQSFTRYFAMTADPDAPGGFRFTADNSAGTFRLQGCRVEDGQVQYVSWVDARIGSWIDFTDAAGNVTLGAEDLDEIEDPSELKGKVVLRDPTFGGVLPGQTNDSFWDHVSAIGNSPGSRVKRDCRMVERDGWSEWTCTRVLPPNPSDLDYLDYYLDWWDRAF